MPLVTGIYVHEGLAALLRGQSLKDILTELVEKYDKEVSERGVFGLEEDLNSFLREQKALLAGLLAGWQHTRLQALLSDFEVLAVEQEVEWELAPGIIQMLRCDALLRRKSDGLLFILEFKTLSSPGFQWQNQWEHNIQILSYCQAVEESRAEPVGGVMIEGLVKGLRRKETAQSSAFYGQVIQHSPFCYAYTNEVDGLSWQWSRKATKIALGWEQWRDGELLKELDLLSEQFIAMPPIAPIKNHMARWRRQTIAAEVRWTMALTEIREAEQSGDPNRLQEVLDFHAPQHDNHCLRYGSPCPMTEICFNPIVEEDPIGSGLYRERQPHHETEIANVATG